MTQPSFDLTCAIPRNGRTFENFLGQLKHFGVDAQEIDNILEISRRSKAMSSPDYATANQFLQTAQQVAPCFGLFVDRKHDQRPYRVGFLARDWTINGVRVRVEGEEPHNESSLIRLDEIDCAVVGLDELLTMTQYYLNDPSAVTKWGMYNYQLARPTDIRIAGSAMLTRYSELLQQPVQDIVGFFLISKPSSRHTFSNARNYPHPPDFLVHLAGSGRRVYVKGRYEGIVRTAYPELKVISAENVEDAVLAAEPGSVGLEIVQTGNTLKRKGLLLHGEPLFLSESVYVVDYQRYLNSERLRHFIQSINPLGYFAAERIRQFALWYVALEANLGESWVHKPPITALFCDERDVANGLRPYRLQTRRWKPDDNYKQEEALALVEDSRRKLVGYYEQHKIIRN